MNGIATIPQVIGTEKQPFGNLETRLRSQISSGPRFGTDVGFHPRFRVEMCNAFNHPWAGAPDVNVNDGSRFEAVTGMAGEYAPRNIQLTMKFMC